MSKSMRYETTELTTGGRGGSSTADTARLIPYQEAHRREWDARPLGRLGRRLVPEVERYAEFFAIARGYGDA
jgi:hypothetical protein